MSGIRHEQAGPCIAILGRTQRNAHRIIRWKPRPCPCRTSTGVDVFRSGFSIPLRFHYGHWLGRLRSEYGLRPTRLVAEDVLDHVHHALAAELFKADFVLRLIE